MTTFSARGDRALLAFLVGTLAMGSGSCRRSAKRALRTDVNVTASEFRFTAPDSLTAGVVTFHVSNPGKLTHQMLIYQLLEGARLDSTLAALRANARRPDHVLKRGGLEALPAGTEQTVTMALPPGEYVMLCGLPTPDGSSSHMAAGMIRSFRAVGTRSWNAANQDSLPPAENTMKLVEYDFVLSGPLHAGAQTLRVENDGAQPHHWILARVAPGTTIEQIDAYDGKGPEPWTNVGGVAQLDPGQANVIALDLPAGWYMFSCIVADAADGRPHFLHGMEKIAEVK